MGAHMARGDGEGRSVPSRSAELETARQKVARLKQQRIHELAETDDVGAIVNLGQEIAKLKLAEEALAD